MDTQQTPNILDGVTRAHVHSEERMATETKKRETTAVKAVITMDGENVSSDKLTLTFANGKILTVTPHTLSTSIIRHAILHGLKQKLVDAAALSVDPATGRPATIDNKYQSVLEVFTRITDPAGQWNKERGEGGLAGTSGYLYRALCRVYANKTPEFVQKYLAGKTPAEQAAMRKHPKIKPVIEELQAEDAARNADGATPGDDLLAALEGDEMDELATPETGDSSPEQVPSPETPVDNPAAAVPDTHSGPGANARRAKK